MFDYINNKLPKYFDETWKRNHQRHQRNMTLRNAYHFHVPFIRQTTQMKFPIADIPRLWNENIMDTEIEIALNVLKT